LAENTNTATTSTRTVKGIFNLTNGTLRATTIQKGAQTGTATATVNLNWGAGTIENTSGSNLTISGVPINLTGAGSHTFNVTGAQTTSLASTTTLAGTGTLAKTGTGRLESASTATGNRTLKADTISISGGQIDLQNNKAIAVTAGQLATINGYAATGRNGGSWDGNGLMTSRSDADTLLTGIAVAENSASVIGAVKNTFGDQTGLSGDETLIMYTYVGDQNLDGTINGDDFAAIDAGFSASGTLYQQGDFNYSGNIDADDYWLIDRNYTKVASFPLAPGAPVEGAAVAGVTAVPEPAAGALLALACGTLLRRRRR
jgi:hypothetical protein